MARLTPMQHLRAALRGWWNNFLNMFRRRSRQKPEGQTPPRLPHALRDVLEKYWNTCADFVRQEAKPKATPKDGFDFYLQTLKDALRETPSGAQTVHGFVNPCYLLNLFTPAQTRRNSR
ncbi:protein O25 [Cercopithecine betaherpesvirus 5]|uniref:Protein O25 n=1 Tax=Simian cytomegalovirus (strain Colburn) TaxID=50292 RepID=G8XU71_SCMVC|nr:protein O25 [Cercopithecine betaherpesvirus 5]